MKNYLEIFSNDSALRVQPQTSDGRKLEGYTYPSDDLIVPVIIKNTLTDFIKNVKWRNDINSRIKTLPSKDSKNTSGITRNKAITGIKLAFNGIRPNPFEDG